VTTAIAELLRDVETTDLEAILEWNARKRVRRDFPKPGRLISTLSIAKPLTRQILGYQKELMGAVEEAIDPLAQIGGDAVANRFGGYQVGDIAAQKVIDRMISQILGAAQNAFRPALETGLGLARDITGRARVTGSEEQRLLDWQLDRNAFFVRGSFARDLYAEFQRLIRDPKIPPAEVTDRIRQRGERIESRVDLYALKLWGLGHLGFAVEFGFAGRGLMKAPADTDFVNWVLTSSSPCPDCPRLAEQAPYGPTNPLPTVPGLGDTQCRTSCLCVLTAIGPGEGPP
jgi:hypothetical protein